MCLSFNVRGDDVGEIAEHGVAPSHSVEMLPKAGFDAWSQKVEKQLAWDKIPDTATGKPLAAQPGTVPPRADSARSSAYGEMLFPTGWAKRRS